MEWIKNAWSSILSLLPWIVAVMVIRIIAIKRINSKIDTLSKVENRENENDYVIKEFRGIGGLFLIATIFLLGLLLFAFIDGQANLFIVFVLGFFIVITGTCTLHLFLWRVSVHGDLIEHRSLLGITKHYNFKDITKGIYKENETLEVYIDDKKICAFDKNVDSTMFEYGMRKRNIPIEEKSNFEKGVCIVKPQSVYYVMPGLFSLAFIGCSLAVTIEAKEIIVDSLVMLTFAIIPGVLFLEFISDKVIIQGEWLYRKKFLRKTYKIKLSEITNIKREKSLFKENLVLYEGKKRIAMIWTKNKNINWLQAKISNERKMKSTVK